MKRKGLFLIVFVGFLGTLFLSSCAGGKAGLTSETRNALYQYYYMEGERQRMLGNNEAAFALLTEAYLTDTTAPAAQYALAQSYMRLNDERAITLLHNAAEGDTTQYWYNTFYARVAALTRHHDEAVRVLQRMIRQHPDKPELNSFLAESYLALGNREAALACYDTLENSMGLTEALTIEKIRLREQLGDTAGIIADARRLQEAYPSNTSYMLLLGDVYTGLNRDSAAWAMYERVRQLEPDNGYLYLSRATFYEHTGDSAAYHREMKTALNNSNIDMDTKLGIFREYIAALVARETNLAELDPLYQCMIEQYPQEASVRELYGFYLWMMKDYARAREQYSIAADLAPMQADTWLYLLSLYYTENDYVSVEREGLRAIEYVQDNPRLYEMVGAALSLQGKYDEAIALLLTAIERSKGAAPQLQSSLYGQLGDVYHETGRAKEAYEQYEKALGLNASNVAVLNNYSYFLALENRDLSRAERMSAMTIKEKPDEPTYLDTYAWILFKKESYSLARIYIERAIEKSEEPGADILEHYGDILAKQGEIDAAVEQWKRALEVSTEENKILEEKIKRKEYIEP